MKKLALYVMLLMVGSNAVAVYWTCPDDSTKYSSRKKALKNCAAPQKWAERAYKKGGLLGHGGIAGTGFGKERFDYRYEPVSEDSQQQEVFVEDKGILGHGGIGGTGIGPKRGRVVETSSDVAVADEE